MHFLVHITRFTNFLNGFQNKFKNGWITHFLHNPAFCILEFNANFRNKKNSIQDFITNLKLNINICDFKKRYLLVAK